MPSLVSHPTVKSRYVLYGGSHPHSPSTEHYSHIDLSFRKIVLVKSLTGVLSQTLGFIGLVQPLNWPDHDKLLADNLEVEVGELFEF